MHLLDYSSDTISKFKAINNFSVTIEFYPTSLIVKDFKYIET